MASCEKVASRYLVKRSIRGHYLLKHPGTWTRQGGLLDTSAYEPAQRRRCEVTVSRPQLEYYQGLHLEVDDEDERLAGAWTVRRLGDP